MDQRASFNAAYAASKGYDAHVVRFATMAEVEPWVTAGVPLVISFAWKNDLVVNDPAASADADVRHTCNRAQLETKWLESSGGTVYLIYPPGHAVPALG